MAVSLLEKYSKRMQISEACYKNNSNLGGRMSDTRKLTVAKCLDNVSKFMNEAFDSSMATQRSDLGA